MNLWCHLLNFRHLITGLLVSTLLLATALYLHPSSWTSIALQLPFLSPILPHTKHQFAPTVPYALPSILIAGTGKGGTTDLYGQLIDNFPTRITRGMSKELGTLNSGSWSDPYTKSEAFSTYLEKLMHPCMNTTESFKECSQTLTERETKYTIDASPLYLERPNVPFNLKRISPQTKVIILLREPVSRAQSLFNHWYGRSRLIKSAPITEAAKDFLNLVSTPAVSTTLQQLLDSQDHLETQSLYYHLVDDLGILHNMRYRVFGGSFYAYSLANWSSIYFQPNRVLIIDSHTYFKDRTYVLNKVSQFLFNEPLTTEQIETSEKAKVRNAKHVYKTDAVLDDEQQKQMLQDFYRPHLIKLGETLKKLKESGCWMVGFDSDNDTYWPFTLQ